MLFFALELGRCSPIILMEEEEEEVLVKNCFPIPNPTLYWFTKLVILQADVFYNCLVVLFSPFLFLLSLISETSQSHYYPPQESKESKLTAESAVHAAAGVPSKLFRGCGVLLKKLFLGFLGAVHVCKILMLLLVVAVILGVGLVRFWAEEPVFIGERLHFDYTKAHPVAAFSFHCDSGCQGYTHQINYKRNMGVPVGHTFYVSLVFLMPESDYNREIGLFQVRVHISTSFKFSRLTQYISCGFLFVLSQGLVRICSLCCETLRVCMCC